MPDAALVDEYVALKDRGQQLFDGLRDLPQYGKRLWEPYFRRTFDVYNKLWKYQQEHRGTLESEYGLQRHEIGEIASRIGQLYYQFYLRKGDTCYLDEAFVFYEAIRARQYLGSASPAATPDAAVVLRRLRYYTRFCVVCVLTGRRGLLLELLGELEQQLVGQEQQTLGAAERAEWINVVAEFRAFLPVEQPLAVMHVPLGADATPAGAAGAMQPMEMQRRLRHDLVEPQASLVRGAAVAAAAGQGEPLFLGEVVLVGTSASQLKFHELPLDVFRMLQALEWQPSSLQAGAGAGAVGAAPPAATRAERVNPHKYILHRANAAQLCLVLATAMAELPPRGALLLYLSADGLHTASSVAAGSEAAPAEPEGVWKQGGVALAVGADSGAARQACCLRAADLWPFCRMPLFLVVESDNAAAFRALPGAVGAASSAPLFCLLAARPRAAPQCPQLAGGGLLSLFLHEPLAAFARLSGVSQLPQATHKKLEGLLVTAFTNMTRALLACPESPPACLAFLSDPFLRTLVLRFIFCHATLCLHKTPKGSAPELPTTAPALPNAVLLHDSALGVVRQLAAIMGVISQFNTTPPLEVVGSSAS